MLQGTPGSIAAELDKHFEAARKSAPASRDVPLEMLTRWLHVASRRMVAGSIWWVAGAVNTRVTYFIKSVTKSQAMFELLPPQRAALQEQGLLDQRTAQSWSRCRRPAARPCWPSSGCFRLSISLIRTRAGLRMLPQPGHSFRRSPVPSTRFGALRCHHRTAYGCRRDRHV